MNRKLLITIIMMDVSSCMAKNEKMAQANSCYLRIYSNLQKMQKDHPELEIKMATMLIGSSASWLMEPTAIDLCKIEYFENRDEIADFKFAFSELRNKLSRCKFMAHKGKIAPPYIALITGNTSFVSCEDEIKMLLENGWFHNALRTVGVIGECLTEIDKENCKLFVGDVENVFQNESEIEDFKIHTIGPSNTHAIAPTEFEFIPMEEIPSGFPFSFEDPFSEGCDKNPWLYISDDDIWI